MPARWAASNFTRSNFSSAGAATPCVVGSMGGGGEQPEGSREEGNVAEGLFHDREFADRWEGR